MAGVYDRMPDSPPLTTAGPAGTGAGPVGLCSHVSCRLAVSDARLALSNFYNITIRIAYIAARLAVLVLWLCDKLGSSTSP